ncbi:uncharacterized protein ZnT33D [Drosophila virilis]|uniref:Zinc transporter 2 n=1 Tax=Drosophila virilis TaxID=7244 RepID=A0A0Q9WKF0_DROVI|nr:uncharacterized protein LOC26531502 [Drosophila virilis]KRF81374.1 uncharacterized protein Dvir_GJ26732 [Drosophila virilis]
MSDNKRTTERGGNLPHPSESENESEDEAAMQAALREMVKIPDIEPRQTRTSHREEPRHIASQIDNLKKNASPETKDRWVKNVSDVGLQSGTSALIGDKDVRALRTHRQKTQEDKPKHSEKVRVAHDEVPKQSETWGDRLKKKGTEESPKRSETWADKLKKGSAELAAKPSTNMHKKKDTEETSKQSETWADKLKKRTPEVPKQSETWGDKLKKKASEAIPKQNDTWADRLKTSDASKNVMQPVYVQITSLAELPEQITTEEQQRLQRIEAASKPKSYYQAKAQNEAELVIRSQTPVKVASPASTELVAVKSLPAAQPAEQERQPGSINILTVPIRRALNYEPGDVQPTSEDMLTPRQQEQKPSIFNNIPQFGRDKQGATEPVATSVATSAAGQLESADPKDKKTSAANFFANSPSFSRARPAKNEAASTAEAMDTNLAQESATNFTNSDAAQDTVNSLIEKTSAALLSHINILGRAVKAVNQARTASAEPAANGSDNLGEAADDSTVSQTTAPTAFFRSLPFFGRAQTAPNSSPAPEELADPMETSVKASPTKPPGSAEVVANKSETTGAAGSSANRAGNVPEETVSSTNPAAGTEKTAMEPAATFFSRLPHFGRARLVSSEKPETTRAEPDDPKADGVISMDAIAPNLRLETPAVKEMTPTTSVPQLITGSLVKSEDMAEDIQAVGDSNSALAITDTISSSCVRARAPKEAGAALRQVVTASQVPPIPYAAGKTSVSPGFTPSTTMPPAEEQGSDKARAEVADLPDKNSLTSNLMRYLFPGSQDTVAEPNLAKDAVHPLTENSRMPSEVIVVDKVDKVRDKEEEKKTGQLEHSESMRTLTIIGRHSHITTTYRDHCHYERHGEGMDKRARRKLIVASILCLSFMICEIIGGILSRSLAIATDAAHLLTDLAGFLISLFALYLSARPSTQRLNFGWYRAEVIGAMLSVYFIWVITGILVWLAVDRLITGKHDVNASIMLITSALAIVVNFIMAIQLGHGHSHGGHSSAQANREPRLHAHASHQTAIEDTSKAQHLMPASVSRQCTDHPTENINVRAAYIHVVGDIIQSFGVFLAACIIFFKPEWAFVDSICTFVFSFIVLLVTLRILRDVMMVLMEATPDYMDYGEVQRTFLSIEGVEHVHNLRIWALSINKIALSAHLAISKDADPQIILEKATTLIHKRYNFFETTIQIEEYTPGMEDCNQCMTPLTRPSLKEAPVAAAAKSNRNSKQGDYEDSQRSSMLSDYEDSKKSNKRSGDEDFKRSSKRNGDEGSKRSSKQSGNEDTKKSSKQNGNEDSNNGEPPRSSQGKIKSGARSST